MPYLKPEERKRLDAAIDSLIKEIDQANRAGDLNYIINRLLLASTGEGRYKDFNELLGAIEAAKLEFYRRKIAPYEDKKITENGDLQGFQE